MPSANNSAAASSAGIKPHDSAVRTAIDWLSERHRKGWKISFERLRDELLSPEDMQRVGQLDEDTLTAIQINLTEWMLAEGQIQAQGEMRRISEYLIGPSGPNWSVEQRDWLQQLGQRPLRLYTVTEVVPDVQVTLCDTLNSDALPVVVLERMGTRGLESGMHLGCRVMRAGNHFELSGAMYPFSLWSGPAVADLLRDTAQEFGHLPDLAQEQGFVIMSTWLQQYVAPPTMPTMVEHYSGELLVPTTDHYRVLDWVALTNALQGCADVEGDRATGWSRIIDCEDGKIRSIASINPGKKADQISVFYKTQTHADQGRLWIKGLAAGAVVLLTRRVANVQAMMAHSGKSKPKPTGASSMKMPDLSPAVLTQLIGDAIRRNYAHWADEPIPMLDHKTPRQAIQSAAGLERVKGLIRSYEASEKAQAASQGRAEVSYDFLWRSVGLTR